MLVLIVACSGKDVIDTGSIDSTDADTDTDTDADTDADSDTDTDTDTEPDPDWAHCPEASAYVGDTSWTGSVQATRAATYCSAQNEGRTLEQELATKAKLHVVEGTYALPADEGAYDLALPVCTIRRDPANQPAMAGTGSTDVSPSSFGGTTYTYLNGSQPMASDDGTGWSLDHTMILVGAEGAAPDPLVLDGGGNDETTGAGATFVLHADGVSAYDVEASTFAPCIDDGWQRNVHTVTFDGGSVEIELYIGDDIAITAPAAFTHATGTLDGVAFDEDDYFQLVYRPGHHHFSRDFAVVFDAPIGDVCALRVEGVDAQDGTTTATVTTADCALQPLATRTVTDEGWEHE